MTLLVLIEHENVGDKNVLNNHSKELLSASLQTGEKVIGVSIDDNVDTDTLARLGLNNLYVSAIPQEYKGTALAVSKVLEEVVKENSDSIKSVLLNSTFFNKEVAGFLGSKLNVSAVTDVVSFDYSGDKPIFTKNVLNGTHIVKLETNSDLSVVTVKTNGKCVENPISSTNIQELTIDFSTLPTVKVISSSVSASTQDEDLENASVVVCGGRGTEGDFSLVYALANQLNGVVGATRVATDEGWVDRSLQIGQTGKNINANLYIGLGVSGAIHHTCALQTCDNIVAICDDEDAPIFEIADFGIVGDINEVVPRLLEELQN